MASTRSHESRWIRRYKVFFLLGCSVLSIQVFLAYMFFTEYVDSDGNFNDMIEGIDKVVEEVRSEGVNKEIIESYLTVDDEGSPSNRNPVNGLFRKYKVPPDKLNFSLVSRINLDLLGRASQPISSKANVLTSNQSVLKFDEFDFVPMCEISTKDAISAIRRAKTLQCKQLIMNITCLSQQGRLYPIYVPNSCPSVGFTAGRLLGCYHDNQTFRLLTGYYANLKTTNSPKFCINMCLQSGFTYAGVQFAIQCFCGNDKPPSTYRLPDSSCNMKCPADPKEACGGYFTINIYETGIIKFVPQVPRERIQEQQPVRIVFLLTLNGRALRQVHRLIKSLFHVDHYFYIHVDARQDYLFRELLPLEKKLSNVHLARKRYATIWGGASLLQMLLKSMAELLKMDWNWDFIINLSESDFPVKTNIQLVEFLSANKEHNFVKSHGRDVQRFIQKQGLDKTFVECDAHMWRTGDRQLPWGVQVDGGSDWVALSRSFVSYVSSLEDEGSVKDELLQGLTMVFKHTLLPAETFFHTVLRNSKFCGTYVDNNLHVTNWKRRLGCKCQYKHVVDWCGCSPNDFRAEDWPRLQGTEGRLLFFARKFEPVISQSIINQIEEWLYGAYPTSIPGLQSYWQNIFHHADLSPPVDDALFTMAMSVARLSSKLLNGCSMEPLQVLQIISYHWQDSYVGTLIQFETYVGGQKMQIETLVEPQYFFSVQDTSGVLSRLKSLHVSSDYDPKEQISRNFVNALGPFSELELIYTFRTSKRGNMNLQKMDSSQPILNVTLLWIDPAGQLADVSDVHLDTNSITGSVKPFLREPLLPGVWSVKLMFNSTLIANTIFLVFPLQFVSGMEVSQQQARNLHNATVAGRETTTWNKFLPNITEMSVLHEIAKLNAQRVGNDLEEWIDNLSTRFYKILDTCIVEHSSIAMENVCSGFNVTKCSRKQWSSVFPDPKSDINSVNNTTGLLNRF